ncbi:Head fiber protein [Acidilutibacter cellobiosedens]|uniref:Head fiber protein n=1 Tax=Acidilutibacter cellobiosedens TaxID=2507161 RepID=A0A410QG70_9FIRM|nr:Head fiber protein [Acidilutibacter cellobiosedens]QAT63010.1 Head fiber protein [Acidilutibacter cellobiosedens]
MSNVKNYKEQGSEKWVVNGILEITEEGVLLLNGKPLIRAEFQEESTATTIADLKADFNSLLEKLKYAGLMEIK